MPFERCEASGPKRTRVIRSLYTKCKVATAALSATFALAGCSLKHGTPARPVVTKIEFLGNRKVADKDLEAAIQSRGTKRLPFATLHFLDSDVAATDEARIERYYRSRGFYDAHVDGWRFAASNQLGRGKLGFIVREGARTYVKELRVEGLEALPEEDRRYILRKLPLLEGGVLSEEKYDAAKQQILQRMRLRGYAQAEVAGDVKIYPEDHRSVVRIATDPGDRYRFGPIRLEGNRKTSSTPILWASAVQPGQIYSIARLDDAQGRIYDLGAFKAVSVDTGKPDENNLLPVTIRVKESRLQAIETAVGGAIERTREQVQTRVTYRNKNLFGGLDQFDATIRGGYAVLPNLVQPKRDGPIWGGEVRFRRPNFFRRALLLQSTATYNRTIEEAYDADSARGVVGLEKQWRDFAFGGGYGLLLYRLTNIRIPSAATAPDPRARPDTCPTPCLLSFVNPHISWDHRNDPIEPRNGVYTNLEIEKGGGVVLGGTHDYWRLEPEFRGYHTPLFFSRRLTFAGRVRTGFMLPNGGTSPVVRRFYSGGPDSMRGYATRRLSPMVHSITGTLVPIGGDELLEASLETRVFATEKLIGAAFIDAGSVEFGNRSVFEPSRVALAAGPGIRYLTPIGPVRFDIGYRFRTPYTTTLDAQATPVREPLWSFHVGLGEAF